MSTIDDIMTTPEHSAQVLTSVHLAVLAQNPIVCMLPFAAGAVKGFCDAAQLPLGAAGPTLLVAPIAAAGTYGLAAGAVSSDLAAIQLDIDSQEHRARSAMQGSGLYAGSATICTAIGYGIGYGAYSLVSMLGR